MLKGFRKVKDTAKRIEDEREDWGEYVPYFSLKSGESALVRFNGGPDEPYIHDTHSIKRGNNFTTVNCAKGKKGHDGCVACNAHSSGDKAIGRPSTKVAFSLTDHRWYHKLKDKERSTDDKEKFKYLICSDDASCRLCKKKVTRERGGQKRVTFSMMWAQLLAATDEKLSKKCKSCGVGRIKSVGYEDGEEGDEIDVDDIEDEDLQSQIEDGSIVEILECTKCEDPERGSIKDAIMEISRVGSGTSTTYKFDIEEIVEPDDWELECEPGDLAALNKPPSAEKMAEECGVNNPFGDGGDDTESYEDDEPFDENDDDPFEDEEEDEAPKRRKKKTSKKKVTKKKAKKKRTFRRSR